MPLSALTLADRAEAREAGARAEAVWALEGEPLAVALLGLLERAQGVCGAYRARASRPGPDGGRRFCAPAPGPNEAIAEALLDRLGPPDDCWFLGEIAEAMADAG